MIPAEPIAGAIVLSMCLGMTVAMILAAIREMFPKKKNSRRPK
jgi:hypothetical protein